MFEQAKNKGLKLYVEFPSSLPGLKVGKSRRTSLERAVVAGDVFGKKVQAYPKYGSEKKGLPTTYYLTVADDVIRTHSELNYVDFVPLNDANAFLYANPLKGLQPGGTLFVQTPKSTAEEVWANVPPEVKAERTAGRIVRSPQKRVL